MGKKVDDKEKQISAIGTVYGAVKDLTPEAAVNVLSYVRGLVAPGESWSLDPISVSPPPVEPDIHSIERSSSKNEISVVEAEGDGISSVGHKWMRRNGIKPEELGKIFSLGLDEIDLVAKKIPGKGTKQKMRAVFLLKGISSYLGSGASRFTHEQVREACHHYDAWDSGNFAVYLKSFSTEVGGTKDSGYNLSSRGLAAATELVKQMIGQSEN